MLRKCIFKIYFFTFCVCFTNICFAEKAWNVEIQPLLWNVEFNGRVQVGKQLGHVDKTKLGGELALQANVYRFGAFANIIYSKMTGKSTYGMFEASITNKFSVVTGGFSYAFYKNALPRLCVDNSFTIEPYVGARYTIKDSDATITSFFLKYEKSQHNTWTDPIVGMKLSLLLDKEWLLSLSGDIGVADTETQYSYSTLALLSYRSQKILTHTAISIGYQILDQHYVHGVNSNYLNWNMKIAGPLLGVFISF